MMICPHCHNPLSSDEADSLRNENARLRALCADLYEFAMSEYPEGTEISFADSMRELGIEVDDG